MLYTFICPKCKDKLIKQDVARKEDYKKCTARIAGER